MWLLYVILPAVGIILGWTIRWLYARFQLSSCEQRAVRIIQEATKSGEAKSKEFLLEAKEQLIREQKQQEAENRERRKESGLYEVEDFIIGKPHKFGATEDGFPVIFAECCDDAVSTPIRCHKSLSRPTTACVCSSRPITMSPVSTSALPMRASSSNESVIFQQTNNSFI